MMTSSPGRISARIAAISSTPVHEWVSSAFRQPVCRSSQSWHRLVKLPSPTKCLTCSDELSGEPFSSSMGSSHDHYILSNTKNLCIFAVRTPVQESDGDVESSPKKNFSICSSRKRRAFGSMGLRRYSLMSMVC